VNMFRPTLFVALLGAITLATFGGAQSSYAAAAKGVCPSQTSIFGTIETVRGHDIYIRQSGLYGLAHISDAGATRHANGLELQKNVFVGAFGCYSPKDKVFHASEITLASSEAAYAGGAHHTETISGRVVSVSPGKIQIETGAAHGLVTINTSYAAKVGDTISASGFFNTDRTFNASSVRVSTAGSGGPVSSDGKLAVSGVVDAMHPDGFSLATHADVGHIRIYTANAKHYGAEAKLGSHICVYGALTENRRAINAEAIIVSNEEPTT